MSRVEIRSEVTGTVWKIVTEVGQRVEAGETIMFLESMKMEIPIAVEKDGTIERFLVDEAALVNEGQVVAILTI